MPAAPAGPEPVRAVETTPPGPDPLERPRSILRAGVLALLVLTPLPFASVHAGAVLAIEIASALLGAFALVLFARDAAPLPRPALLVLACALGIALVGVIQLAPLPAPLAASLGAPGAPARAAIAPFVPEAAPESAPWSLSPADTSDALARFVGYVALGLAAAVAFREPRHLAALAVTLVLCGVFQAVYGGGEYLSGSNRIFGYEKKHYVDCATGTFINRNHFAGYLAAILPFAFALAARAKASADPKDPFRARVASWGWIAAAALLFLGILLSQSRGGLAAALAAVAAYALLARAGRPSLRLVLATLAIPAAFLLWRDTRVPLERVADLDQEVVSTSGRAAVWKTSLGVAARFPIVGTGLGTFEEAFRSLGSRDVGARYDHAHNDPIQAGVEGGVVSALLLLSLGTATFSRRSTVRFASLQTAQSATLASIAAITVHSLVDFGVRIPALAVLLAVVLAVGNALPNARR
ncbi:MAG TPA: O-antigen ligase family protein [Candidatus Polarisedimenticolaceae bacterium]